MAKPAARRFSAQTQSCTPRSGNNPPHTIDLGTLGGPNSAIFQYNHGAAGQFVGWSETSKTDPNDENFCGFGTSHICLGFSWQHGKMTVAPDAWRK